MSRMPLMFISPVGLAELKTSEDFRQYAYPDPYSKLARAYPKARWGYQPARQVLAGLPASAANLSGKPWTVGYGEATNITMFDERTQDEALEELRSRSVKYGIKVLANLTVAPTQLQFDALLCLCWNVEAALAANSSVVKAHNRRDWKAAAEAFLLYSKVRVDGRLTVSNGLLARRKREAGLYLEGCNL